MKTERIAWECPACSYRHRWDWERGEASPGPVTMCCDKCGHEHITDFVQIGRYVWSAVWHDDNSKVQSSNKAQAVFEQECREASAWYAKQVKHD